MQIYQGKSVCGGIAIGKLHIHQNVEPQVKCYKVSDPRAEITRFQSAKEQAVKQLDSLYKMAVKEIGEENAAIFQVHQMMLQDADYGKAVVNMITTQEINAEYAVLVTQDSFYDMFSSMDDDYMKARAADIKDISRRVLDVLSGREAPEYNFMEYNFREVYSPEEPMIILAQDLAPSETVQLDKEKVLSFVTVNGSTKSHTAILARTMGIPALVATAIRPEMPLHGRLAVVDGDNGCIYVDPDEELLQIMRERQAAAREKMGLLLAFKGKESITLDGRKIAICANIGNSTDLPLVFENDAEGIGLFRSEFLYLEKDTYPTEEEQFESYKAVAQAMSGKRVIIRTLDIGADKQTDYMQIPEEENPAMGLRAIRMCLTRPQMFKTQLRALYRASAFGKIAVMYPMITSVKEIKQIKALTEEVKAELAAEGIPFTDVEQGIMIETPAAAIISDLLAKEVDFFSIGTNDLTQYALAVDRQNEAMDAFYDPYHTAVLRMIALTVENAHRAGIWCGICGELGADTRLTQLFLALGVDELSVSPGRVLAVRKVVRETDVEACKERVLGEWL